MSDADPHHIARLAKKSWTVTYRKFEKASPGKGRMAKGGSSTVVGPGRTVASEASRQHTSFSYKKMFHTFKYSIRMFQSAGIDTVPVLVCTVPVPTEPTFKNKLCVLVRYELDCSAYIKNIRLHPDPSQNENWEPDPNQNV